MPCHANGVSRPGLVEHLHLHLQVHLQLQLGPFVALGPKRLQQQCVSAALPIARYFTPDSSVHILHAKRPDGFKHLFSALGSLLLLLLLLLLPMPSQLESAPTPTATTCYMLVATVLNKSFSQMPIPKPHVLPPPQTKQTPQ